MEKKITFEERLHIEKNDLAYKIDKLVAFLESKTFEEIKEEQKMLLNIQLKSMETYFECLHYRIANL